ncbi:MAG: AI-2E family transporter [Nocardioidaceae bacterium]
MTPPEEDSADAAAVVAEEAAEEAAEVARESADDAQSSAERASASADEAEQAQLSAEEASEEFLRDAHPDPDAAQPYGAPGRPIRRRSPFFMGFFGAVGALLAFWLGQQLLSIGSVLLLIVVAMFLALGLNPAVEFFLRRGFRRSWAVLTVIVLVLAVLALFVLAIAPMITDQISTIVDSAPRWGRELQHNDLVQSLDRRFGIVDRVQQAVHQNAFGSHVFGGVLGVGMAVLSAVANTFIVVVLMLYFLASLPGIKRFAYNLAPSTRRERVTYLGDEILGNVGAYVSGAFIVALCAGVSSLVFLFVVGMGAYAMALAAIVTLLDIIPMIGATLGAVIVIAIGFTNGPTTGIACLVFYVVYQQFENYVIYPKVMSRSVDIPGSVIVIAALVGAALLGVVGALLAIPTAAAIQLLVREVLLPRQEAH